MHQPQKPHGATNVKLNEIAQGKRARRRVQMIQKPLNPVMPLDRRVRRALLVLGTYRLNHFTEDWIEEGSQ